ncbi:hypothetical protein EON80_13065 [bacterium]|nr:MAG: hypothetical protein EON80_13065 [bacterium]
MKRLLLREVTLLSMPVLMLGGLGMWLSGRPGTIVGEPVSGAKVGGAPNKPLFHFRMEKPTMMETLDGNEGAFVVELKADPLKQGRVLALGTPSLELQTARGKYISRFGASQRDKKNNLFGAKAWGNWDGAWDNDSSSGRYLFNLRGLPAGKLIFHFGSPISRHPQLPLQWEIDRTKLPKLNLATMPRRPMISIREVTVKEKTTRSAKGEIVFQFHYDAKENGKVDPSEMYNLRFEGDTPDFLWGYRGKMFHWVPEATLKVPDTLVVGWFTGVTSASKKINLWGRTNANDKWPLDFQIGPFSVNRIRVGQKLKFKSWPAPLPR